MTRLVRRGGARSIGVALALLLPAGIAGAQPDAQPLSLIDVPFLSQSEDLCGGAAAAMILRYWGERGLTAESFSHLIDGSVSGISTTSLAGELQRRGWNIAVVAGGDDAVRRELVNGRPVLALIEDRRGTFHYVVIVGWHDRGVVFHDPARAPFRVMARSAFERRWAAAHNWMLVLAPGADSVGATQASPLPLPNREAARRGGSRTDPSDGNPCDRLVSDGIRQAQANDLAAAEHSLAAALGCPGSAPLRELAGVRLLQKRWSDAGDLATAALAEDSRDEYSWRLLGTSRFVQDDPGGALDAWNHVGEPRVDLVRIEGLSRTTHRVVEDLIGVNVGAMLTSTGLSRAGRRLEELPSAASTRLDYAPVPSGLAELRASVAERPRLPRGAMTFIALGVSAAAAREVQLATGSFTGGGEALSVGWRFWPQRPRYAVGFHAPARWGGVWGLDAFAERQPFSLRAVPPERGPQRARLRVGVQERTGARLSAADWATAHVRWELGAGVESWKERGTFGTGSLALRAVSRGARADGRLRLTTWSGKGNFSTGELALRLRSSTDRSGRVLVAGLYAGAASHAAPWDLWFAGDTGHVRPVMLRAHPILDEGHLRVAQLGRRLEAASVEAQWWRRTARGLRVGAAVFGDFARTADRVGGDARRDVDAGIGARLALPGLAGTLRLDLAKGLRDGATALSLVYQP